jgi:hypothetical protein
MRSLLLVTVFSLPVLVQAQPSRDANFDAIQSMLKAGTIKSIEIVRVPDDVETRVDISPSALRAESYYTITLNEEREPLSESLLDGATFQQSSQRSDLRWGLFFRDGLGRQISEVFVDRFGMTGYVNGESVRFNVNMSRRLRQFVRTLR